MVRAGFTLSRAGFWCTRRRSGALFPDQKDDLSRNYFSVNFTQRLSAGRAHATPPQRDGRASSFHGIPLDDTHGCPHGIVASTSYGAGTTFRNPRPRMRDTFVHKRAAQSSPDCTDAKFCAPAMDSVRRPGHHVHAARVARDVDAVEQGAQRGRVAQLLLRPQPIGQVLLEQRHQVLRA